MLTRHEQEEVLDFFGKISFFILGLFALGALVMQINTVRDRKRFNKEWGQFGYNVEAYLPDRIKSAFPDVESVDIQRLQNLYNSVYAKGTKHSYYFRNIFTVNVHMDESFSALPITQKCAVTGDIYNYARDEIERICAEYTPFYKEKKRGFSYSNKVYGSDMTELPFQVLNSRDRFTVYEVFERLDYITDETTGIKYEYDKKTERYRDQESMNRLAWDDYMKSAGRPAESGRLPFVGMREYDIDKTLLGKHTERDVDFKSNPIKTTYVWKDSRGRILVIAECKDSRVSGAYYYYQYGDNYDKDGYPDKKSSGYSGGAKSNSSSKSGGKSTSYDAYDEGYEDVWMDDDFDWDRYENDDDYAQGVDDAMEDEDW